MADKAGVTKEYTQDFLLDEGKLRKLSDILHGYAKRLGDDIYLRYYVGRQDDSYYQTRDIDEVLHDDNSGGKHIVSLSMSLRRKGSQEGMPGHPDADDKPITIVSFMCRRNPHIEWAISGEDRDWCFLLADELDGQIGRTLMRPPLRFVPRDSLDLVCALVVGVLGLHAVSNVMASYIPHVLFPTAEQIMTMSQLEAQRRTLQLLSLRYRTNPGEDWLLPMAFTSMWLLSTWIITKPLSRAVRKLSRSWFYWGDAVAMKDRFEKNLNTWLLGGCLAFVVGVAASLIASYLYGRQ